MKIVIDTNILISGIFFSGPPYQILKAWFDKKFELIVSEEIYNEYSQVCERLHQKYPTIEVSDILELIAVNAHFYQPIDIKESITIDPDDDKFFKCALASEVNIIVSGDRHLKELNGYQGIEVIPPSDFIKKYLK